MSSKIIAKTVMKEIIYCVEILKLKHELLKSDRKYFYKIQDFEKCAFLRDNEKQIEVIVKKLLEECKKLIFNSESEGNSELRSRYNGILSYFELDFETRKVKLETLLSIQKKSLNTMMFIFKFREVDKIRNEIKQTEEELKSINALIFGNVD